MLSLKPNQNNGKKWLYLCFLATYSPETNSIEGKWYHIKAYEIAESIFFEDKYTLAKAVKPSLYQRSYSK